MNVCILLPTSPSSPRPPASGNHFSVLCLRSLAFALDRMQKCYHVVFVFLCLTSLSFFTEHAPACVGAVTLERRVASAWHGVWHPSGAQGLWPFSVCLLKWNRNMQAGKSEGREEPAGLWMCPRDRQRCHLTTEVDTGPETSVLFTRVYSGGL